MPHQARLHGESRKILCFVCFNKGKDIRNINENIGLLIKQHCFENYDYNDQRFPSGICGTCRISLQSGDVSNLLVYDYSEILERPTTRFNTDAPCYCKVCSTARQSIGSTSSK